MSSGASQPACDACKSRKVRCDRKQPRCSNCARYQVECTFVQRGKRTNHTKRLANDFATIQTRLDGLERAVLSLGAASTAPSRDSSPTDPARRSLARHDTNSYKAHLDGEFGSQLRDRLQSPSHSRTYRIEKSRSSDDASSHRGSLGSTPGSASCIPTPGGSIAQEHPPGPSSNVSCTAKAYSATLRLRQRLYSAKNSPPSDDLLRSINHMGIALNNFSQHCNEECVSDCAAIELPPRLLLEALLPEYLQIVDSRNLISSEAELRVAIHQQYNAPNPSSDPVWAVAFTSIVVHMLYLDSCSNNIGSGVEGAAKRRSPMESAIAVPLLSNLRCAYNHIDRLIVPRMENVQALVLLAHAGQLCFPQHMVDRIIQIACQIAQLIGLQSTQTSDVAVSDGTRRSNELFWALFILDRQLALTAGRPPFLWSFESDIMPPAEISSPTNASLSNRDAWCQLATVQENIWRTLFWPGASPPDPSKCDSLRNELLSRLDALEAHARQSFSSRSSAATTVQQDLRAIEFEYALHSTTALVLRDSQDKSLRHRLLRSSRYCLHLLKIVQSHSGDGKMQQAVLAQILHYQSFVPFFSVYEGIIDHDQLGGDFSSDMTLLAAVMHSSGAIRMGIFSSPLLDFLASTSASCINVLTALTGHIVPQGELRASQVFEWPERTHLSSGPIRAYALTGSGAGIANTDPSRTPSLRTMSTNSSAMSRRSSVSDMAARSNATSILEFDNQDPMSSMGTLRPDGPPYCDSSFDSYYNNLDSDLLVGPMSGHLGVVSGEDDLPTTFSVQPPLVAHSNSYPNQHSGQPMPCQDLSDVGGFGFPHMDTVL